MSDFQQFPLPVAAVLPPCEQLARNGPIFSLESSTLAFVLAFLSPFQSPSNSINETYKYSYAEDFSPVFV